MTTLGADLTEALKRIFSAQATDAARNAELAMAEYTRADLEALGAQEYAPEIFDLFRRARRQAAAFRGQRDENGFRSNDSVPAVVVASEVVAEQLKVWCGLDHREGKAFYSRHLLEFEELQSDFVNSRGRRSHLQAVLRPLDDTYSSQLEKLLPGYPAQDVRKAANRLRVVRIASADQLDQWWKDVFELFKFSSVFAPTWGDFPPLQAGIVSENSVGIYKNRWDTWLAQNREELVAFVTEDFESLRSSPFVNVQQRLIITQRLKETESELRQVQVNMEQAMMKQKEILSRKNSHEVSLTLKIRSNSDKALNAKRSWSSESLAKTELGSWFATIETLWGGGDQSVTVTLQMFLDGGSTEVELPETSLSKAAMFSSRAIDLIKTPTLVPTEKE